MSEGASTPQPIQCALVVGGKYHDFDFARLELLKILAERDQIRTRVFEDFEHIGAIAAADFIVSYTCDVIPSPAAQDNLRGFVEQGGRFYALHGTNSILRILDAGKVDTPDLAPSFMETLGTSFAAHPPIGEYRVELTAPDHPLCAGLRPFTVTDELYLSRARAEIEVLLHTTYRGETPNFTDSQWPEAAYPVLYLRKLGRGCVLYLTLGHCRGHYDLRPLSDWWPQIDRGSWATPVFYELLRRGIAWAGGALRDRNGNMGENSGSGSQR
jgi:type 1 glutamine amidotransferase